MNKKFFIINKLNFEDTSMQNSISKLHEEGKCVFSEQKTEIEKSLNPFKENNIINGTQLQNAWFPKVGANVFISHSHQDLDFTTTLSGYIKCLGFNPFVDSHIWDYADELLKQIDNECCLNYSNNYSYNKRNKSTAHVHMMLSAALTRMIYQCDIFIFINSNNSIPIKDYIKSEDKTFSPWIYHEVEVARLLYLVQNNLLTESVNFAKTASDIKISYNLDLEFLEEVKLPNLEKKLKEIY